MHIYLGSALVVIGQLVEVFIVPFFTLGLALLQQRLQALLRGPALVVVADQEDDVVPAVDAHHLEPHAGLVGVGRHRAEEAQVYALRGHRRAEGPAGGALPTLPPAAADARRPRSPGPCRLLAPRSHRWGRLPEPETPMPLLPHAIQSEKQRPVPAQVSGTVPDMSSPAPWRPARQSPSTIRTGASQASFPNSHNRSVCRKSLFGAKYVLSSSPEAAAC